MENVGPNFVTNWYQVKNLFLNFKYSKSSYVQKVWLYGRCYDKN